jgi:predicted HTH transcriptional regulator
MHDHLTELERIIRESQTLAELVGSVRIWARSIFRPTAPDDTLFIQVIPSLNYRQQWAVKLARAQGRITSSQLAARFDISAESARLDLRDCIEKGSLLPISEKKGRYYIPVLNCDEIRATGMDTGIPESVPQPYPMALQDTLSRSFPNPKA